MKPDTTLAQEAASGQEAAFGSANAEVEFTHAIGGCFQHAAIAFPGAWQPFFTVRECQIGIALETATLMRNLTL